MIHPRSLLHAAAMIATLPLAALRWLTADEDALVEFEAPELEWRWPDADHH